MRRTGLRTAVYTPSRVLAASCCALGLAALMTPPWADAQPAPATPGGTAGAPAAPPAQVPTPTAAEPAPVPPMPTPPPSAAGSDPDAAAPDELAPAGSGYPDVNAPYPRHRRYGRWTRHRARYREDEAQYDPWTNPVPARFTHDGFFLRLNFGPAFGNVWRPDYRWTGLGLGLGISVGGSIIENLSLHADFRGTLMSNPTQHSDGRKTDFDADIVFQSMGIGATYYVMPVNLYASLGAGVGVLSFEDSHGASKDTTAGLTVTGTVGKEWWVASDWGLGIAAQLLYTRVKDYVDDRRMHGITASLLFSATYN